MNEAVAAAMPELETWIGRKRVVTDEMGLTSVRRVAATLDADPDGFAVGDPLPSHWFNLFCPDICAQSLIGPDGHPRKGVFLPPIPLPRRMGAGRRVAISGALVVGQEATKTAEVAAITPKTGRSGDIVVLTMRLTFETAGTVVAVDEFDAIYREAVPPGTKTTETPPKPAPTDGDWQEPVHFTETLVFRYSAITWNAHRIHYDADYTREVEGYKHTVQNGGLTMQTMVDAAVRNTPGTLRGFTTRLTRPIWVGDAVTVHGRGTGDGCHCWIADADGNLCAQMDLDFA